jgi:hypothetical protein
MVSSHSKLDIAALTKDIPQCDFIGNVSWKKGVMDAINGFHLSRCLVTDIQSLLDCHVVAKKLTTAKHWQVMTESDPLFVAKKLTTAKHWQVMTESDPLFDGRQEQ